MQAVEHGTGEELYRLVGQELQSVGIPTWDDRANASGTALPPKGQRLLRVFTFVTDQGPDNVGMARRIRFRLKDFPLLLFIIRYCFFHQYHLLVKAMILILDNWDWDPARRSMTEAVGVLADADPVDGGADSPAPPEDEDRDVAPVEFVKFKYFTGVGAIANVWQSPGIPRKIRATLSAMPSVGPAIAHQVTTHLPGRLLRERWGSIDKVEQAITAVMMYLALAFKAIFPKTWMATKKKKESAHPGADEDKIFQENQKKHRQTATRLLHNPFFKISMMCSLTTRDPTTHFFRWSQKKNERDQQTQEGSTITRSVLLGPHAVVGDGQRESRRRRPRH